MPTNRIMYFCELDEIKMAAALCMKAALLGCVGTVANNKIIVQFWCLLMIYKAAFKIIVVGPGTIKIDSHGV